MSGDLHGMRLLVPPFDAEPRLAVESLWSMMDGFLQGTCEVLGARMAYSVMLSRIVREMRREAGIPGAKDGLATFIASMPSESPTGLIVLVPPFDDKMASKAAIAWDMTGRIVQGARPKLGAELTFSTVLSRLVHDWRRDFRHGGAKLCLEGYVASMDQAAQGDLQ